MRASGRGLALVAGICVMAIGLAWLALFGLNAGTVTSHSSNSMSHSDGDASGVLDPGEWLGFERVDGRDQITTFYEGRRAGHEVAGDWGDVIEFRPVVAGDGQDLTVVHRALAWIEYNETADAYDVPELALTGVRGFTLPSVGTWDADSGVYLHRALRVTLDPASAGRHDGYVTKGDHNRAVDQDASGELDGIGKVELVAMDRVEGVVVRHVESYIVTGMIVAVPLAALAAGTGYYGYRAIAGSGELRRRRMGGVPCRACSRDVQEGDPFCYRCGSSR